MEIASELTVILKDDESTYRQKFLLYDQYTISPEDPTIMECIEAAKQNLKIQPNEIQIKIHLEVA